MNDSLNNIYKNTEIKTHDIIIQHNKIFVTYTDGAKVEILGNEAKIYRVEFIDAQRNVCEYATTINNNCWCITTKKYYIDWLIRIYTNDELIYEERLSLVDKDVYINIDSSALGDTIAWMPIADEFRKKHGCKLHLLTHKNSLFVDKYPEINFIKPGTQLPRYYSNYSIGLYYKDGDKVNYDMNPTDFRKLSLQNMAASILGLEPMEVKPKLKDTPYDTTIFGKYVVIAPHASAHAKYWNYPNGWQIVIDYLNSIGYKVVMITSEPLNDEWHDSKLGGTLKNVIDKTGKGLLDDRMVDIKGAKLFIGLGSGLSWLSWALGTKTMLISGFSEPHTEFSDCIRVSTPHPFTCSGCFNRQKLDAGDWDWCPEFKNTPRMFECTKTITPEIIINEINKVLL
jgi:autotransporter strand-loop-strand O-heptosyltransferase